MIVGTYKTNIPNLLDIMKEYALLRQVPLDEVLVDQANKLSNSNFGGNNIGLFQHGANIAPSVDELLALPQKLGYRIKRRGRPVLTDRKDSVIKSGKNAGKLRKVHVKVRMKSGANAKKMVVGEINRRIARRYAHAIGWLTPVLSKYQTGKSKGRQSRKAPPADVTFRLTGDRLEVIITNRTKQSAEINLDHGDYISVALNMRKQDMVEYIQRKLDEQAVAVTNASLPPPK